MKFTISRDAFKKALMDCQVLVQDPLVLISSSNNTLHIEAAFQGSYYRRDIPCTVEEDGVFAIDPTTITPIQFRSDISVEVNKSKFNFKSGNMKGSLDISQNGDRIANMRPPAPPDNAPIFTFKRSVLQEVVQRTSFISNVANAQDGLRIQVKNNPPQLVMSSTDNFRATFCRIPCDNNSNVLDLILKPGLINQVISRSPTDDIIFLPVGGILFAQGEGWWFCHPTVQTEPSDVEGVLFEDIPTRTPLNTFVVKCSDFCTSLKDTSSVVQGTDQGLRVNFKFSKGKISFSFKSDRSSSDGFMELPGFLPGKDQRIVLNFRQFVEMLSLFGNEVIKISSYEEFVVISVCNEEVSNLPPNLSTSNSIAIIPTIME